MHSGPCKWNHSNITFDIVCCLSCIWYLRRFGTFRGFLMVGFCFWLLLRTLFIELPKRQTLDNVQHSIGRLNEAMPQILRKSQLNCNPLDLKSRDSSVGIPLGYGLDDRGSRVRFPAGAGNFSLHRVQNGSGAQPASYPMGTGALSLRLSGRGVKLSTHLYLVPMLRVRGAVPPFSHTPSWRGA
jgi:hypothetical protein